MRFGKLRPVITDFNYLRKGVNLVNRPGRHKSSVEDFNVGYRRKL